ncbi:MAG: tRNA (guanosine(18)-2'-O)-methyltransferase TrmH [Chlorobium limicola]|uniref:tRNA (guanosine(18)-2'-O)-methyltransferase n=1 Tax=Chlorobium limicola (strain DSM 245 / NBRC 103803 / 6330) TaxID=290315 RepID=B3EI67_CHLL2|nr:tRNA (guanosine(18)-2'-O)-methyltransferase TrmH [Chlorobium limicola]ACD89897.1 tRNA guanosine-2'-O-methyltransferase [Chlorobium limicola DSM 245]NTV07126.1 tRNA (guanosine(18)-2'-O)-methyltransferase TrmH [Chlorobium limicola]NTV19842.1 tRNA (guanosine(18)-2'-O)-methyltransferase TrmH [Chlorobium limicola]
MASPERFRKIRQMLLRRQTSLTVVMDNVNKSHNLAALVRSCDAAGIHEIHAVSRRKHIFTRHNAAAGSSKWVNINLYHDIESVYRRLRDDGMQVLAAASTEKSVDFREIDYTLPTALILGAEWDGISEDAISGADRCIGVPMFGMVESLNVSVAGAVIIYEAQRQRLLKGMYGSPALTQTQMNRLLFEHTYPRLSEHLHEKGIDYPRLDDDGFILSPEI